MNEKTQEPSFAGAWTLLQTISTANAPESLSFTSSLDVGDPQLCEGVLSRSGLPDVAFFGSLSTDGRVWSGQTGLPAQPTGIFLFVLAADGRTFGGNVTYPNDGNLHAVLGTRTS